jgi:hypothetical protein
MVGEAEEGKPEFSPKDMQAVFHVMLQLLGGHVAIPKQAIDEYPEDAKLCIELDEVNKIWHIHKPRKPKRQPIKKKKIVQPDRRILVPGDYEG